MTLALALALSTGCITAIDRSYTFTDDIHTIDFMVEAGDVTIQTGASDRIDLTVSFGGVGKAWGPQVEDGVLMLDYDCEGLGICGGELTLTVPEGVLIVGHLSMGDLSLEDVRSPVDLSVDTGSISAEGLSSPWISLMTGAGDVSAEVLTRPDELHAVVGAGALDLEVPAGIYSMELEMSAGAITLEDVTDDPSADALITARVGTGDLSITGR